MDVSSSRRYSVDKDDNIVSVDQKSRRAHIKTDSLTLRQIILNRNDRSYKRDRLYSSIVN